MTLNQERFCVEYLKDGNATKAAQRAGYSERSAYSMGGRLLKNDEVQQKINDLLQDDMEGRIADARECLVHLTAIMRGEVKDEAVFLDKAGNPIKTKIAVNTCDRLKASEILMRVFGCFEGIPQQIHITFEGEDMLE